METGKNTNEQHAICSEIMEMLPLYIEGHLDVEQAAKVDMHLALCPECVRTKEELQKIQAVLSKTSEVPVPDGFDLRLKKALRMEIASRRKSVRRRAFGALAASVMIVFFSYNIINDGILQQNNGEETAMSMKSEEPASRMAEEADLSSETMEATASNQDAAFGGETEEEAIYAGTGDYDYQKAVSDKLEGYDYTVISDTPESGEMVFLILSDDQGNTIGREFTIQYRDGVISSPDNWLDIDFEQ